ncbi:MAG: GTPase ObgE [Bacillota bacterium]|jgi:GTP-binding protein|nr:GTPase ObgE [Bacillota bacterium]NLH87610.1 GTPase ObgE [Bacillota bacterium]
MFVDLVEVSVRGGDGGHGEVAFRREKFVPRGGPSGGDGGNGGNVIAVADRTLTTLTDFRYKKHLRAKNGARGGASKMTGAEGEDLVVRVPVGTIVKDAETGEVAADLVVDGQRVFLARGGAGGRGNARFATSVRRAPRFAEKGEPGEERRLTLELRLLADVGLIGYPNAGKSTLLSKISSARPRIADYPFTTLSPVLGVVEGADMSFVVADIPGLIEGAADGVGLGHEFLRHVMRTRILVHVVDVSEESGRDPLEDYRTIRRELELYHPDLPLKPEIVAANKVDMPGTRERAKGLSEALGKEDVAVWHISALTGEGVKELLYAVVDSLSKTAVDEVEALPQDYQGRQAQRGARLRDATVERDGDEYVISGEGVERLCQMTDMNNLEAYRRFWAMLAKAGIVDELRKAGAVEGDIVRIGDIEIEYGEAHFWTR